MPSARTILNKLNNDSEFKEILEAARETRYSVKYLVANIIHGGAEYVDLDSTTDLKDLIQYIIINSNQVFDEETLIKIVKQYLLSLTTLLCFWDYLYTNGNKKFTFVGKEVYKEISTDNIIVTTFPKGSDMGVYYIKSSLFIRSIDNADNSQPIIQVSIAVSDSDLSDLNYLKSISLSVYNVSKLKKFSAIVSISVINIPFLERKIDYVSNKS